MMGLKPLEPDPSSGFVEVDPTGRYGRYNEILGKGASKTVYKAFDEYEGIEVAWNQVKLNDFLQSPEELERLYCEIHLLKTLKHKNIMKFYTSWVDIANRNINFVTEMFTSGTLRQYRQRHRRVNIRAVKHWCRQILRGLLYLHSLDPPVIHRDLKCDNIFVNGNQGEVKIGDLGLAAILRKSYAAHCVGTPEFMAPEVYEEEYNELVDIYSFGMCVLEMVTSEYPYSECTHPAQIYKKVISGKKPDALYKVEDPEVRQFVDKCLATASQRLSARELLKDPFLQIDDYGRNSMLFDYQRDLDEINPLSRQPFFDHYHDTGSLINGYSSNHSCEIENEWDYDTGGIDVHGIDIFTGQEDEPLMNVDITIKGKRRDDEGIFLRLRIVDKEGRVRNIYFPFDIEIDTALSVATEMVAELDITDQDVTKIAEMIDGEISSLVPEWKPGPGIDENPGFSSQGCCHNFASNGSSNGSLLDYLSSSNPNCKNLQALHCSHIECSATHGRFEEITYQVEGHEHCLTEDNPVVSSQANDPQYMGIQARCEGPNLSLEGLGRTHSHDESKQLVHIMNRSNSLSKSSSRKSEHHLPHSLIDRHPITKISNDNPLLFPSSESDDCENEIRQELRWLRAKYQMELRDISNKQFAAINQKHCQNSCPDSEAQRDRYCEAIQDYSPEQMFTANNFYTGTLLPQSVHRSKSLPVDAVDF